MMYYVLDNNNEPQPVTVMEWATAFERRQRGWKRVGLFNENGIFVSTVFLGMDHRYGTSGPPILFETYVKADGDGDGDVMERYCTWTEAEAGHEKWVEKVKRGGQ